MSGEEEVELEMDNIIVSFCIATFQRYEVLVELIQEILLVDSDKFEVIVCDDKSLDTSVMKLKGIRDDRLKIYVNEENVGSLLNIHDALSKGQGKYLFYINDRDNVDNFKIRKLIEILEDFEKKNIAFAKCVPGQCGVEKYHIFKEGEESLVEFACRMDHPTGFIFKKDVWDKIENKRRLFENQKYGDYVITQVCAIMAKKYKGALIYGDICDLKRHRIDFSEVKSGYYNKRKDKRLWYTPEVIFRELKIGQKFLQRLGIKKNIKNQILIERYTEYLFWCVSGYKDMITDPACTAHYGIYPSKNVYRTFIISFYNGIKLWGNTSLICLMADQKVRKTINIVTIQEFRRLIEDFLLNNMPGFCKRKIEIKQKDGDIYKRESALNTYERWIYSMINGDKISNYLMSNDYRRVAIYGMGRLGKQLFEEFDKTSISIEYIIDQKMAEHIRKYESVPCFTMSEKLPFAELIIVTVPSEEKDIITQLRKKTKGQIKSINDILFVMN